MDGVYMFKINDDAVWEPDEFTMTFAKSKINCPRCIRWIEKAEKLLSDRPLVTHQDIPGVCDHCWRQLAKIQKLVQLAKKKEKFGVDPAELRAQVVRATGEDEDQTKEPKEFKEILTAPSTPTSRARIISESKEGKTKDEKLKDESVRAKDKKSIAREDSPSSKDKKSKATDEILIEQEESLSTTYNILTARDEKSIAQEETRRTKDIGSKARDDKSLTQVEVVKTRDKGSKAISQEEALRTKDKGLKAREEKAVTQVEAVKTKDKGSKAISQEEALRTKDKGLKARDEKSVTQVEAVKTKDKGSKAISQEEELRKKDKGSKLIVQEEGLKTKDQRSKARYEKPVTHEELHSLTDEKSKTKDETSVAQEETLKDKQSKVTDEKPKAKEELSNAKDKKSKAREQKPIAQEKPLAAKEEKPEAKQQKQPREATSTEQLKVLIAQEKLRKEKEKLEAENKKKQQEQEKKLLELAEKRAKEAALEMEKEAKAKSAPPKLILPVSDSEDNVVHAHEHAVHKAPVVSDIIIGEKICKNTRRDKGEDFETTGKVSAQKLEKSSKAPVVDPETPDKGVVLGSGTEKVTVEGSVKDEKTKRKTNQDSNVAKASKSAIDAVETTLKKEDGTIRYSLSDRTFIDKGWTMLPLEKVVRKMNVYRMRPSKPEFDWFEHNKNKVLAYDTGERLAEVDGAGHGRWYYRNGELAMDYYDAEETNAGRRFVVYSSAAPDERGRPRSRTVLATFDHSGNGIVFDHAGKTRLKYNQTEGVVLDREIGPVSHWKWHTLNDPPVLQPVMIDTQLSHKDPEIAQLGPKEEPRRDDQAMLSIELDNFVKEKLKKSSQKYKPFQIKMKALKINENFSLRVLDQASVYLSYRDGTTYLKINIGMLLDHKEIVDTDTSEIDKVANRMEQLPAYTGSIAALQREVARARARAAGRRAARMRLAGCAESQLSDIDSVDAIRAAISRPPRTPLVTCSASATHDTLELHKPCSCDLYCKPLF